MLNNLLFYRLIIFNSLALCALFFGYKMGLINTLITHDAFGMVYAIGGLLGLGVFGSLVRGFKVSQALNKIKNGFDFPLFTAKKMVHKNEYIRDLAGWSVLMGLLGNAIGFVTALSGNSNEALLAGAGVAFGSTAAGILTALWLEVNFSMIRTATGLLTEDAK